MPYIVPSVTGYGCITGNESFIETLTLTGKSLVSNLPISDSLNSISCSYNSKSLSGGGLKLYHGSAYRMVSCAATETLMLATASTIAINVFFIALMFNCLYNIDCLFLLLSVTSTFLCTLLRVLFAGRKRAEICSLFNICYDFLTSGLRPCLFTAVAFRGFFASRNSLLPSTPQNHLLLIYYSTTSHPLVKNYSSRQ